MDEQRDEAERQRDEGKCAASPDAQQHRADRRPRDEARDDERVVPRLREPVRVGARPGGIGGVRPAAQIARAHGRGERQPMDAPERLDSPPGPVPRPFCRVKRLPRETRDSRTKDNGQPTKAHSSWRGKVESGMPTSMLHLQL